MEVELHFFMTSELNGVVSFTPWSFYRCDTSPRYAMNKRLGGLRTTSGCFKSPAFCINRTTSHRTSSQQPNHCTDLAVPVQSPKTFHTDRTEIALCPNIRQIRTPSVTGNWRRRFIALCGVKTRNCFRHNVASSVTLLSVFTSRPASCHFS